MTAMAILGGTSKAIGMAKLLMAQITEYRMNVLFKAMEKSLRDDHNLDIQTATNLIEAAIDSIAREKIYEAARRAFLAEGQLAVAMLGVLTARYIHDQESWTQTDSRLMKMLQQMTDDEIIFCDKLIENYEGILQGRFSSGTPLQANLASKKVFIDNGNPLFSESGRSPEDFRSIVDSLKQLGLLAEAEDGSVRQMGSKSGIAMIIDITTSLAHLFRKSFAYQDSDR